MRILESLRNKLKSIVWWFRYRLHPSHRYHVINTMDKWGKKNGITYGWEEVDSRMLSACFKLLVDYVEKQRPFEILDFDDVDESRALKQEIVNLYEWWTVTRPKQRGEIAEAWKQIPRFRFDGNLVWRPHPLAAQLLERNRDLDDVDDKMLERLVRIRRSLWT